MRAAHGMRLRNYVARSAMETLPGNYAAICENLSGLGLATEMDALRQFFTRDESILIHSDENSIGDNFGHAGYRRGRPWPFYPNGEWLCAAFSAAALSSYADVHLVFTLRRFDEMVVSSLKNAIRSPRRLPPLRRFSHAVSDLGSRCRILVERVSSLDFVRNVHLLDYELLRSSPRQYFETFVNLSGSDHSLARVPTKRINASAEDADTLDRLVERGVISRQQRLAIKGVGALLGDNVLTALAVDYDAFRQDMLRVALAGGKIKYYS